MADEVLFRASDVSPAAGQAPEPEVLFRTSYDDYRGGGAAQRSGRTPGDSDPAFMKPGEAGLGTLLNDIGEAFASFPGAYKAAWATIKGGTDLQTSLTDKGLNSEIVDVARERAIKNASLEGAETPYLDFMGFKLTREQIRNAAPQWAFSLGSLAGAISGGTIGALVGGAVGAAAGPVGAVAGRYVGGFVGGFLGDAVAYLLDYNQSAASFADGIRAAAREQGIELSDEQLIKFIDTPDAQATAREIGFKWNSTEGIKALASTHAAHEIGWERGGNLVMLASGKMLWKAFSRRNPLAAVAAGAGAFAGETLSEAGTQIGQHSAEVRGGIAEGQERSYLSQEDWMTSLREVFGPVLTTIVPMAGATGAASLLTRGKKAAATEQPPEAAEAPTKAPDGVIVHEHPGGQPTDIEVIEAAPPLPPAGVADGSWSEILRRRKADLEEAEAALRGQHGGPPDDGSGGGGAGSVAVEKDELDKLADEQTALPLAAPPPPEQYRGSAVRQVSPTGLSLAYTRDELSDLASRKGIDPTMLPAGLPDTIPVKEGLKLVADLKKITPEKTLSKEQVAEEPRRIDLSTIPETNGIVSQKDFTDAVGAVKTRAYFGPKAGMEAWLTRDDRFIQDVQRAGIDEVVLPGGKVLRTPIAEEREKLRPRTLAAEPVSAIPPAPPGIEKAAWENLYRRRGAESRTIDEAAHEAATSPKNNLKLPSKAQIDAANYKVGHFNIGKTRISIENPQGTNFVVDQRNQKTKAFDEHKVMVGNDNIDEAEQVTEPYSRIGAVASQRFNEKKHKKVETTGRIVGSPQWVGADQNALKRFRNTLLKLANEGLPFKNWYKVSADAVWKITGGNMDDARRLIGLLAIYSSHTGVRTNTKNALKVYYQHKYGLPPRAAMELLDKKAAQFLKTAEWEGIKTNAFWQNLMEELDPSVVHDIKTTQDMWMAVAGGYESDKFGEEQYMFMHREVARVAEKLGIKPHEAQAAIWVATNARGSSKFVKDAVAREAKAAGFPESVGDYNVEQEKQVMRWTYQYLMVPRDSDIDRAEASYSYASALKDEAVQISTEAKPGTKEGSMPGIHAAPMFKKIEFQVAINDAFTGNDGKDIIAKRILGLVGARLTAFSGWDGESTVSVQDVLHVPTAYARVGKHWRLLLNLLADIRGLVFRQDAVAWHYANYSTEAYRQNGVEIDIGRPLTEEENSALYRDVSKEIGNTNSPPIPTGDGMSVRFLNFYDEKFEVENKFYYENGAAIPLNKLSDEDRQRKAVLVRENTKKNNEFEAAIRNALIRQPWYSEVSKVVRFASDGNLLSAEEEDGTTYRGRIAAALKELAGDDHRWAGSSDIQEWIDNDLIPLYDKIAEEFAKRYGWGELAPRKGGRVSAIRWHGDTGLREERREDVAWEEGAVGQVGPDTPSVSLNTGATGRAKSVVGIHYGDVPDLPSLDGSKFNKLKYSEEARRILDKSSPVSKRVYFYVQQNAGVLPKNEAVVFGGHVYRARLDNLYDIVGDPDGIAKEWREADFRGGMTGLEEAIYDAGYDGYYNKDLKNDPRYGAVVFNSTAVPAEYLGIIYHARDKLQHEAEAIDVGGIPAFVKVDGRSYPTRYSDGTPVGNTVDEIQEYWRRFTKNASAVYAKRQADDNQLSLPGLDVPVHDKDAAVSTANAAVKKIKRSGGTIEIANGIAKDFIETSKAKLIGRVLAKGNELLDLALLAQIYRNPSFETLHAVFTDSAGKVIEHIGITSRIPYSNATFVGTPEEAQALVDIISEIKKRTGAKNVYQFHNHPAGDPTPSRGDVDSVRMVAMRIDGFAGHVVINQNSYVEILPGRINVIKRKMPRTYDRGSAKTPSPFLGRSLDTSDDIAALAQDITDSKDQVIVASLFFDTEKNSQTVSGLHALSNAEARSLVENAKSKQGMLKVVSVLRKIMRSTGATGLRIVVPDNIGMTSEIARTLVRADLAMSVSNYDGMTIAEIKSSHNLPDGIAAGGKLKGQYALRPETQVSVPIGHATAPISTITDETRKAFESGIGKVYAEKDIEPKRGIKVLDRSDVISLLGLNDGPVYVRQEKVLKIKHDHPNMTEDVWKKLPDWFENPVAVLYSETGEGDLLRFIAPEIIAGSPVFMVVDPKYKGAEVSLMLSAYDKSGGGVERPMRRWARQGLLVYIDNSVQSEFERQSGIVLPKRSERVDNKDRRVFSDRDLKKFRAGNVGAQRWYYSGLERAFAGIDRTMPAKQWKLWLQSNAAKLGIRKDEIEATGVIEWLDTNTTGKVSALDIRNYLSVNAVVVNDKMLSDEYDIDEDGEILWRLHNISGKSSSALNRLDNYLNAPGDYETAHLPGGIYKIVRTDQHGPHEYKLLRGERLMSIGKSPVALKDKVYDEEENLLEAFEDSTKYADLKLQLPGGKNYRELLLTLPEKKAPFEKFGVMFTGRVWKLTKDGEVMNMREFPTQEAAEDTARNYNENNQRAMIEKGSFRSPHFQNVVNPVAHIRFNDRTDAAGKKVLFIEEIQSDWAQKGRAEKFAATPVGWTAERLNEPDAGFGHWQVNDANGNRVTRIVGPTAEGAIRKAAEGIPAAPFVTETKAWVGLALKRMIAYAAENGYDRIAWTTGAQQADRYNLSKHLDSIRVELYSDRREPYTYNITGYKGGADVLAERDVPEDKIADYIGKEAAQRVFEQLEDSDNATLSGLDLKVGGKGMLDFYDRIVPQVANNILKKIGGGNVTTVAISTPEDVASEQYRFGDRDVAATQPGFDITPAMRETVGRGLALFAPRTTKDLILNSLYAQRGTTIIGDSGRAYTTQQRSLFKHVGREADVLSRANRLRKWASKRWVQGFFDQFEPLKQFTEKGYTLARLSRGASGAYEAFLRHGKLKIRDGTYDADTTGGALNVVFFPIGKETTDFLYWIAGHRAERLSQEDREFLFRPEDIAAAKSLSDGDLDFDYVLLNGTITRNRDAAYRDTLRKFNEFNKNAIDMAQESGLLDATGRKYWEDEFYVPFYRLDEDEGGFRGATLGNALIRQEAFKKLRGGPGKLNDLFENTLMNWYHLIDASAKNRAAVETLKALERHGAARLAGVGEKKTVWAMVNGRKVEWKVEDHGLLAALNSLDYAGLRGPIFDVLTKPKHWLTVGVTASPFFKIRNLIRDSVQAIATSDLSYNPLKNVKRGFELTDRDSQEYVSALAGGGLIRFGTMLEGNEAQRKRQLIKLGATDAQILDNESRVRAFYDTVIEPWWSAYQELGNRGEEINRMSLYDQMIRSGMDHATASLAARDLLDFSSQGTFTSIRFLTQVVPFFNARLQGMYKLGRAAKNDPARMATVLFATSLVSLYLLAQFGEDDDWKRREEWDRDNYWWFKLGGVAYRIPKPFEIGAIATLTERVAELVFDNEMTGTRFRNAALKILSDQLALDPTPQMVKPLIDIYANKDRFSGRPIESMGMERLDPEYRYRAGTTLPARAISSAAFGAVSPVQVDHLVRAYAGWLGGTSVAFADIISRMVSNEPTRPSIDMMKLATGGMVAELEGAPSRYITKFYEQVEEFDRAYATVRQLAKEGRAEEARAYALDNIERFPYRQVGAKIKSNLSLLNQRIRMIENSALPADEKRAAIIKINQQKEQMARAIPVQ